MKRITKFGTLGLAVALTVPAVALQRPQDNKSKGNNQSRGQNQDKSSRSGDGRFQGTGPRAGDWLRRNMNTPPAQQKQELEKSDDFKKLPPARQQQLLNQLNQFNNMTPGQKNRWVSHMVWLDNLSPDQRQKADTLHQQFHDLSADRRIAVRKALVGMRDMGPDERQRSIDSPQMRSNYSDHERQIIRGYTELGFPDQHADDGTNNPQEEM